MDINDYDAFLFDWDGTLARSLELWLSELHKQHVRYNLPISIADNARLFGDLQSPLRYGLPPHLYDTFQQETNDNVQAQLPNTPMYNNAKDILQVLKSKGKKLALITASTRKSLDLVIADHDVEDLFDIIVTEEVVKTHKPDPEGINLAIERLGVDKSKAIMLGDSDKDLRAAKNAGIDSALFYPPAHEPIYVLSELQSHGPKYTIRAWQELLDQLQ